MQAHRLRVAEAQRVHVVKLVVDQGSQCAALLLADSSCLLVSLAGTKDSVPLSVPAPCTDACFLRLQARVLAGASPELPSSSSHSARVILDAAGASDGVQKEVNSSGLRGKLGDTLRDPELREEVVNGISNLAPSTVRVQGLRGVEVVQRELYVVTARPGKGGSCTDLRAWFCAPPEFARADVEFQAGRRSRDGDGGHELQSGKVFARLDAPHGLAVKMGASINVLVVYSSSAGTNCGDLVINKVLSELVGTDGSVSLPYMLGTDGLVVLSNNFIFKFARRVQEQAEVNSSLWQLECGYSRNIERARVAELIVTLGDVAAHSTQELLAGKAWILTAKWVEKKEDTLQSTGLVGIHGAHGSKGGLSRFNEGGLASGRPDELRAQTRVPEVRKGLLLMKSAVVDCQGPVYCLHVSPLHLFLGESKGVRVWFLRPLIKRGSVRRDRVQMKPTIQVFSGQSSHLSNGKPEIEVMALQESLLLDVEVNSGLAKSDEKFSNGIHVVTEASVGSNMQKSIQIATVDEELGGPVVKIKPRNGRYCSNGKHLGLDVVSLRGRLEQGNGVQKGNLAYRSSSELEAVAPVDIGTTGGLLVRANSVEGKIAQGGGGLVLKKDPRNGMICSNSADPGIGGNIPKNDDLRSEIERSIQSQGDRIVPDGAEGYHNHKSGARSFMSKAISEQRNGIIPAVKSQLKFEEPFSHPTTQNSSHQYEAPVDTSGSSSLSDGIGSLPAKEPITATSLFAPLNMEFEEVVPSLMNSNASRRSSPQPQVVDIQALSLKKFVVLDSYGRLHLLILHELAESHGPENLNRVSLSMCLLQCSLRVSCFAMLPQPTPSTAVPPQRLFASLVGGSGATTVGRKLWISDGMYSVHVVLVPDKDFKANMEDATEVATLTVSQAVFTRERVEGLVAGSQDTVMVLMKGGIVAYVMAGG